MTPVFIATIQNARLEFDSSTDLIRHLHSLEGKRVTVTVEREKRKRSNQQNKWYWGVILQLISEHTGTEPEDLHDALKAHFSKKSVVGSLVVPSATRYLDTVDFGEYCEKVRRWAAEELNINIPDPEQVDV